MSDDPPFPTLTDALPSRVPGIHWPAVVGARDAAVLSLMFQMKRSQWLSADELHARQSQQLRALLAHARRHSPFYRERLPDDLARWHEIPLLTRADLQTQADAVRATAYPRAHGKTFDIATGGSTGEPVTVRRTALTQLFWQAATLCDHLWHRRDFSATMAIIRQFPGPVDSRRPGRWGGIFRSGSAWHLPISTDVDTQLRWLQGVDPHILLTYPANYTTTSMGRLTLNILLSFAQFEREVTGERIRDKIAAAKKKGLWMGGVPTIGYDVVNRQLVDNQAEAAVVRQMFEEMLTIGSPTQIAARLTAEGITTKAWTTQDGRIRTGTRIDKKYIHKVLRNRIYLGELSNRGQWYPGQHEPIIKRELWDKVQAVLARDSHARSVDTKIRSRNDALLRGLLYAPSGERMYPTYSRKNGRKYQYYVSKSESRFGAPGKGDERLPAGEIEAAVVAQIRTVLTSPESIAAVVRHVQRHGAPIDEATVVMAMGRLNDVWDQLFPVERHRIANLMIERIDLVHTDEMQGIKVKWRELGWDALIGEFAPRSIGAELLEVDA